MCESAHQVCNLGTSKLFVGCAHGSAKVKAQKPVQVAVLAYEVISQAIFPEHSSHSGGRLACKTSDKFNFELNASI